MTTRHRQLNLIIQRVPSIPGNPFDPFNSGPTEGAPVKVWARRQDSPVRSELEAGTGQLIALNESPPTPCGRQPRRGLSETPSSTRDGARRQVKGVAQLQQHGGHGRADAATAGGRTRRVASGV